MEELRRSERAVGRLENKRVNKETFHKVVPQNNGRGWETKEMGVWW
jgi:hypothetical protein